MTDHDELLHRGMTTGFPGLVGQGQVTGGPHILLQGVVGSTAYGLATEGSDVDRLGIFAVPTVDLHGLADPELSIVTTKPDKTLHEAKKFCRLTLNGNPTVQELLWLTHWDIATPTGQELVALRSNFLCAPRVRDAYLGYATQQFVKLQQRQRPDGTSTFSSTLAHRTEKHARHMWRLCLQGFHLYATGVLVVDLGTSNAQHCHEFGDLVAAGDIDKAKRLITRFENLFDRTTSPLPAHPDVAPIEAWLRDVREREWDIADWDAATEHGTTERPERCNPEQGLHAAPHRGCFLR